MSALAAHARAMRVLGEEWEKRGRETGNQIALMFARVHLAAADRLEAEIAANTGRRDSGPLHIAMVDSNPPGPDWYE